jgi:hypothetical protein
MYKPSFRAEANQLNESYQWFISENNTPVLNEVNKIFIPKIQIHTNSM